MALYTTELQKLKRAAGRSGHASRGATGQASAGRLGEQQHAVEMLQDASASNTSPSRSNMTPARSCTASQQAKRHRRAAIVYDVWWISQTNQHYLLASYFRSSVALTQGVKLKTLLCSSVAPGQPVALFEYAHRWSAMKTSAPFLPYLVDSFETTKRRTTAAPERVLLLHFEVLNLWIERLGCSTACLTGQYGVRIAVSALSR
ncbi:hypothetical protein PC117_g13663 [Phytophthora cactorum]|uniref:Uncharacterized protein n=2 Tax=Phytophthora cactorum TaxID=29920 RepID=A0A8T1CY61_9STRA|nr:hypothetical protein PC117_g13663 [Phytophthora cactorum]